MAYLGNVPARSFISFERQVFTIVNSQTAYTLSHSVTNENDIRLVVNNVVQEPGSGKAYTASGTTLTLSAALVNGTDEMYCVFLGRAVGTVNAPAGSVSTSQLAGDAVTEAKIADGAVESEHLNNNVISGQTALASEPADTDEFLVSDAGTLKRIDYSLIKGGGITEADFWRVTTAFTGSVNPVASNWERCDESTFAKIGTGMSQSSGVWTFPSTGLWYIVYYSAFSLGSAISRYVYNTIETTPDNSNWTERAIGWGSVFNGSGGTFSSVISSLYINVDDTANDKVRFGTNTINSSVEFKGSTDANYFSVNFIRLGDSQ